MTLIEVLMGTLVVSLVLVSASWALSQASTSRHVHAESPINAALLAKELHELALTLPTAPSGGGAAIAGSGVLALDTLDGASFTPPIDSAKASVASATGWTQLSHVSVYALSDLDHPTSSTFTAVGKSSTSLYRLSVQVKQGSKDMGTWWWWINP
jgi:hypothetical protein